MMQARSVWYRHPGALDWLLADVDLEVAPGEIVGLQGPSGTGKTTLARLLAGWLVADHGTVTPRSDPAHGRPDPVQLVPQHPHHAVDPRWRLDQSVAEAGVFEDELLDLLAIEPEWLTRHPNEVSGGELQRIVVARALAARPDFLVADEITAALDPLTQVQVWHALVHAADEGLGILAISHDRALLDQVASRVLDIEQFTGSSWRTTLRAVESAV